MRLNVMAGESGTLAVLTGRCFQSVVFFWNYRSAGARSAPRCESPPSAARNAKRLISAPAQPWHTTKHPNSSAEPGICKYHSRR